MIRHDLRAGTIWEGDWLSAPLEPGYTLAILDGPYGMGKAAWDRMSIDGLADWYAPHIARVSALLAPSASVYLWNTAEGWARIDPVMRANGWTFRALVTWDKGLGAMAGKIDTEAMRTWFDVTEVCGFYQREGLAPLGGPARTAYAAGASERNTIRTWLNDERERAAIPLSEIKALITKNGGAGEMLVRHSFYESQWCFPTWEQWAILHKTWNGHGHRTGLPYLQRDRSRIYDLGDATDHEALRAEYEALRAEYEALRAPFALPSGVTNVWALPQVSGGERIAGSAAAALHPCQKPLVFAERMIRASSRPGDRILIPFGGTCREAVICEWLARTEPAQARRYDTCELNADGVDYIGPVLAQIRGESTRPRPANQCGLFAPASEQPA